jgi:hypothetical protein
VSEPANGPVSQRSEALPIERSESVR